VWACELLLSVLGWLTDSIEANIESASVNVVRGSEHIRQARSHLVTIQFTLSHVVLAIGCIAHPSAVMWHILQFVDCLELHSTITFLYRWCLSQKSTDLYNYWYTESWRNLLCLWTWPVTTTPEKCHRHNLWNSELMHLFDILLLLTNKWLVLKCQLSYYMVT